MAGPWLARTLEGLRRPEGLAQLEPGEALRATLRPCQQAGVRWLYLLYRLGLGACLADDMGLGKTIQVLALLVVLKREAGDRRHPSLLVAPASLLANWASDLWSIFDFVNPGLLGSAREFAAFTKRLAARPHRPFEPRRELVRPYVLRRLKTDRSVIADLPDKTEVKAFCALSRKQAALYLEAVKELGDRITTPPTGWATPAGPRRTAGSSRGCARSPRCSPPGRRRSSSSCSSARRRHRSPPTSAPSSGARVSCSTGRPR